MQIVLWLIVVVVSYFLGNINGALIISRLFMKDDVRRHGSGNAGLTNFFRTYGGIQSVFVIAIDVIKCVLACLIAGWILPQTQNFFYPMTEAESELFPKMVAGCICIIGHSFPVLEGFRGGKGIMSGLAMALATDWRVAVSILCIFIIFVALTKYVSLGSVLAATAFAVCYNIFHWGAWSICIVADITACFVILRHRKNIVRLFKGTESKLSFHKNRGKE